MLWHLITFATWLAVFAAAGLGIAFIRTWWGK